MSNGRLMRSALRVATLAICVTLLNACASGGNISGSGYNPTTPKNAIDADALQAANVKRVVIADVNLGSPSRKYLKKREADVDAIIAEALERNGWEVVSSREFTQRWRNAVSMHCLLYTSPSPRDRQKSRMPSSA